MKSLSRADLRVIDQALARLQESGSLADLDLTAATQASTDAREALEAYRAALEASPAAAEAYRGVSDAHRAPRSRAAGERLAQALHDVQIQSTPPHSGESVDALRQELASSLATVRAINRDIPMHTEGRDRIAAALEQVGRALAQPRLSLLDLGEAEAMFEAMAATRGLREAVLGEPLLTRVCERCSHVLDALRRAGRRTT